MGSGLQTSGKAAVNTGVSIATVGVVDEAIEVTEHDLGYEGARFGFEVAAAAAPGGVLGRGKDISKGAKAVGAAVSGLDTAQSAVITGRGVYGGLSDGWDANDVMQTGSGLVGLPIARGSKKAIDNLAPKNKVPATRFRDGQYEIVVIKDGKVIARGHEGLSHQEMINRELGGVLPEGASVGTVGKLDGKVVVVPSTNFPNNRPSLDDDEIQELFD